MSDKKKVLVIDDEPDFAYFVQAALEDNGYEADTVSSSVSAMDKIEEFEPDLVTLDLMMPEKTGIKFYRELRKSEKWGNVPVIIVTGVDRDSEGIVSFKNFLHGKNFPGPEAYLEKPLDLEKLMRAVRGVLG